MLVDGGLSRRVEELPVNSEELTSGQQTFLKAMEETKRQLQAVLRSHDLAFFSVGLAATFLSGPQYVPVSVAVLAGFKVKLSD
jgi:hypothetical protein